MPRKNHKLRLVKNTKLDMRNFNFGEKVELTKHIITQAKKRRNDLKNLSDSNIRRKLTHEIKSSQLISIQGKEEHRNFQGHIFVVKRENGKLVGITYLWSQGRRQTNDLVKYQKAC